MYITKSILSHISSCSYEDGTVKLWKLEDKSCHVTFR